MKTLLNFSSTLLYSNSLKWILSLTILLTLMTFIGCKKSKPVILTPEEQALENLAVTWALGSVTRGTEVVTDEFLGFVLELDGSKTFLTTNGMDVFPVGTQWDFDGEVTDATGPFNIIAGGVNMEVTSLIPTNLTLSFPYTMPGGRTGGRMANLSGEYVFSLEKQN